MLIAYTVKMEGRLARFIGRFGRSEATVGARPSSVVPSATVFEPPVSSHSVPKRLTLEEALAILSDPTHPKHDASRAKVSEIAGQRIHMEPYDVAGHTVDIFTGARLEGR